VHTSTYSTYVSILAGVVPVRFSRVHRTVLNRGSAGGLDGQASFGLPCAAGLFSNFERHQRPPYRQWILRRSTGLSPFLRSLGQSSVASCGSSSSAARLSPRASGRRVGARESAGGGSDCAAIDRDRIPHGHWMCSNRKPAHFARQSAGQHWRKCAAPHAQLPPKGDSPSLLGVSRGTHPPRTLHAQTTARAVAAGCVPSSPPTRCYHRLLPTHAPTDKPAANPARNLQDRKKGAVPCWIANCTSLPGFGFVAVAVGTDLSTHSRYGR
jgi:hypothetical protein